MPLIGGNKYSCEPCIRGHRATHCNHTDRILIEVRKPGRPLDRCAHAISTCSCTKHLKNSTVVEVTVKAKERSVSPTVKLDGETKKLMISNEMPFARELRLSPPVTTTVSDSCSGEEQESSKTQAVKRKAGGEKKQLGERRKEKVTKRHRLDKTRVPTNLVESRMMDVDFDLPALSPSVSESGSEQSMPAYFEPKNSISVTKDVVPTEKTPTVVYRGISISDLLT